MLDQLFDCLTAWLAPILCFTAEEAWTGALELARAEKRMGSSLQAHPRVHVDAPALYEAVAAVDLAEVAITSDIALLAGEGPAEAFRLDEVPGVAVVADLAAGEKCQRCWRVLPEVGTPPAQAALCGRCADAVDAFESAAE